MLLFVGERIRENLESIGVIHSPFKELTGMPIQSAFSKEKGVVEVFNKYKAGLKDIDGFSHLIIIFVFHKSNGYSLLAKPFLDDKKKGVFATRSPHRPNRLGLSIVKLVKRKGNKLTVTGIDVLDGTPLLDIKPYVPKFDCRHNAKSGWLKGKTQKNRGLRKKS